MESFNHSFTSSIKPSSVTDPSFNDAGGNDENEPNPTTSSKLKKQLPTKNFMSPTICTANKANLPKKKILGERNETLDVVEQPILRRSGSFDSKSVKSPDNDVQKPYDPITNYLSPRPKFLRYNPNRRRNYVFQGNEESVRSNDSFDVGSPYSGIELGADSSVFLDSCSKKESVESEESPINNESECEEGEGEEDEEEDDDEEEEEIEFEEDRFWSFKGVLKFLVVVIAVISTTQAICSMNSPTPVHTVEAWSTVNGVAGFNFSEIRFITLRPSRFITLRPSHLVIGRSREVDIVESTVGVHDDEVVSEEETSDSLQELETPDFEAEVGEKDDVQVETVEIAANEAIGISVVVSESEIDDQIMLTADSDENEEMLTADSDENEEIAEEMKEIYDVEGEREDDQMPTAYSDVNGETAEDEITEEMEELNDVETSDDMIRSETSDLNLALLFGGFTLILTSLGLMYSKRTKTSTPAPPSVAGAKHKAKKDAIRVPKPSANTPSLKKQINEEKPPKNSSSLPSHDVSEEFSQIHAPSVELLGEIVFGEEAHTNNSSIQTSTHFSGDTKASHVENSTGNSVMVRKQRRKNVEAATVITPSPVRRSSRLQSRSIKSP